MKSAVRVSVDMCGCERSFYGVVSRKSTTTAKICDVPTDFQEIRELVVKMEQRAGIDVGNALAKLEDILLFTVNLPEGAVIEVWNGTLLERAVENH